MKPESISEKLMFNTVRLETESGMGTGFFYNFKVGENIYILLLSQISMWLIINRMRMLDFTCI